MNSLSFRKTHHIKTLCPLLSIVIIYPLKGIFRDEENGIPGCFPRIAVVVVGGRGMGQFHTFFSMFDKCGAAVCKYGKSFSRPIVDCFPIVGLTP